MDRCPRRLKRFLLFWSQISLFQLVFTVFSSFLFFSSLFSTGFLSASLFLRFFISNIANVDLKRSLQIIIHQNILVLGQLRFCFYFFYQCAACRCVCIITGYVGAANGSCYAGKKQRSSQRSRHFYVHRVSTHTVHVMRIH